ncbi:hypothetical protein ACHAXR_012433 [Thalassiosira sp. AJA248-18]
MSYPSRIKRALIICDMQGDVMPSLFDIGTPPPPTHTASSSSSPNNDIPRVLVDPAAKREAFLDATRDVLRASISSPLPEDNALVIFLGLRFPSRYEGLDGEHCLYGSLRRLNEKVGDQHCHWFMEGHAGSEINAELMDMVVTNSGSSNAKKHVVLWRTGHLPPTELSTHLVDNSITDVTIVGAKASQSVQATVQYVADHFPAIDLSVIQEALGDATQDTLDSIVQYLLPLYSRVASVEEYVMATCGLERFAESIAKEEIDDADKQQKAKKKKNVHYISNCERGGHFSLFSHHLMNRKASPLKEGTTWMNYPTQKWYEDVFRGKQYYCPLGKRVVTFCDEPSFSEIAMFLNGRDCLEDTAKLMTLAKDYLPESYIVKGGLSGWESVESCPSEENSAGPWFIKETNKNGDRAIQMCTNASDCIALANNPQKTYVIQRHVPNPHLTKEGRKWHFKLYSLLIRDSAGSETSWTLRCHNEVFFCEASDKWSADNLTPEAQVTIMRTKRFRTGRVMEELDGDADMYQDMFQRCSYMVSSIVQRAIESKELEGRPGKKQFELFSTDFMFDMSLEKLYVIKFNLSPVIFDPHVNQIVNSPGLQKYQSLYQCHGEDAEVNDHDMIKDAVSIVFFPKEAVRNAGSNGDVGGWRVVQSF